MNPALPPSSSGSPAPQRQAEVQYNTADAAVRGASLAFLKPSSKPKPLANTYSGNNGALAAAKRSTVASSSPDVSFVKRHSTGGSAQISHSSSNSSIRGQATGSLGVPASPDQNRRRSPANVAAALAAARHTPTSRSPRAAPMPAHTLSVDLDETNDTIPSAGTVNEAKERLYALNGGPIQIGRNGSPGRRTVPSSDSSRDTAQTDATPIPPTTSLVKLFEQGSSGPERGNDVLAAQGKAPPIKSPKPQRVKPIPIVSNAAEQLHTPVSTSGGRPSTAPKPTVASKPPMLSPKTTWRDSLPRPSSSQSTVLAERAVPLSHQENDMRDDASSSSSSYTLAPEIKSPAIEKPSLPPPRRAGRHATPTATMNEPTKPKILPPPATRTRSQSNPGSRPRQSSPPKEHLRLPITNSYQRASSNLLQPHMTGDSLANAIVASALASSRASSRDSSPVKSPAPPLPKRNHHHPFHSRSPSPPKPKPGQLRRTMRSEPSSSDSEDSSTGYNKHKKKRHFRKHPNKHHEGARKRWRNILTERERKRYEGVWAANKGCHITFSTSDNDGYNPQDDVLNIVVKDIWSRSRLPSHVLEEIWDLVDERGVGRLVREEFVVGMWLIDQRLKGRKLPVKVQESVWASVRAPGVKIRVRR